MIFLEERVMLSDNLKNACFSIFLFSFWTGLFGFLAFLIPELSINNDYDTFLAG